MYSFFPAGLERRGFRFQASVLGPLVPLRDLLAGAGHRDFAWQFEPLWPEFRNIGALWGLWLLGGFTTELCVRGGGVPISESFSIYVNGQTDR